jgi:signal transduction histidine kinase
MTEARQRGRLSLTWPLVAAAALLAAPGIFLWARLLIEMLLPSGARGSPGMPMAAGGLGFLLAATGAAIVFSVGLAIWLTTAAGAHGMPPTEVVAYRQLRVLHELCAGTAHEINGDLMAINASLEIIQKQAEHERLGQHARVGRRSVTSVHYRLEHLLSFARSQAPRPALVELRALCEAVLGQVPVVSPEPISGVCNIPDDLWPVWADPDQLEAAIFEMASYAARNRKAGGNLSISAINLPKEHTLNLPDDPSTDFILIECASRPATLPSTEVNALSRWPSLARTRTVPTDDALAAARAFADGHHAHLFARTSSDREVVVGMILPRRTDLGRQPLSMVGR